ncbi:MAG: serine/threonine protein kinase [Polyangiaceae bacterium]|nr:serine/threonine protein kinase [Polyangiaceae bacterium]
MPPRTQALRVDVLSPGAVLSGRFRVERVLGQGGMGVVVAAHHLQLDRRVALKFLLPEAVKSEVVLARFLREARTAARLQGEHVARVIDVGTLDEGTPFLVMEYLEGRDLADTLKLRGALPQDEAVTYVLQACEALAEAHAAGIVHRDLKPANLFLARRPDGTAAVKVLDFGISKASMYDSVDAALTRESAMMGSPAYMSPEQLRSARDVDHRTDVWSLGVVLYELLTGRVVFDAATLPDLHVQILSAAPSSVRVRRPELPPLLDGVVMRCLEKDPARRFSSVADLAAALAPFAPPASRIHVERAVRTAGGTHLSVADVAPATALSPAQAWPQAPAVGHATSTSEPLPPPRAYGAAAPVFPAYPVVPPALAPEPRAQSAASTLAVVGLVLLLLFVVFIGGACVVCAGVVSL